MNDLASLGSLSDEALAAAIDVMTAEERFQLLSEAVFKEQTPGQGLDIMCQVALTELRRGEPVEVVAAYLYLFADNFLNAYQAGQALGRERMN